MRQRSIRMRKRTIPGFGYFMLIIGFILGTHSPARAKPQIEVTDLSVSHSFGDQIEIQARIEASEQIQNLEIVIQSEDNFVIVAESVDPSPTGEVYYILDLEELPVRAFSSISIWFEIELEGGASLTSDTTEYFYDDNRFEWQDIHSGDFSIYWYQDDPDLGSRILNAAYDGVARIQSWLHAPMPDGIDIYAYASAVDMQQTLMFSGGSSFWVAGHTDSDLGVIVVSLPPGAEQILEIQRQIPHELVHIMLYRKMGPGYISLPRWLNEGLASAAELLPNPDYQLLLDKAHERDSLIPIQDLCASFPIDAANFQLAYAESFAFTWFLQQTYGKEVIEELIQAYADGLGCEQGVERVLGVSLVELETEWRQAMFNENQVKNRWLESAPMMIVFGIGLIIPISLTFIGVGKRNRLPGNKTLGQEAGLE